ncbi:MAG: ATP-binding cassette domain-containing protein, partial [Spirochaetales bacterium]|nr:ATP-binding cassette domain-containing protein [Spirochaetales bacterium]
ASLPDGLAANLWERGGNLSAGERQLMSFARALAADPELIILDEATSNVDMHTEERIKESIEVLRQGRTMVVVAHRLSSILEADRILFLREGRLIAEGTHTELYATLPEYRTLVDQQFPSSRSRQGKYTADELEGDLQGIPVPVGRGSGSTGNEA